MRFLATLVLLLSITQRGLAAEDLEELVEKPSAEVSSPSTSEAEVQTPEPLAATLQVGLVMDTLYSGGGSQSQGFSLPLARLALAGDVTPAMAYRFSLGQTREFSSSLLPQILPVEAFVVIYSADRDDHPALRLRAGMFTPTFNPWWTPDLGQLDIPDYSEAHRALFIGRDLGVELAYRNPSENFELGVGTCNGTGVLSLNTNNSKAATAFTSYHSDFGSFRFTLGAGYFYLSQSTTGSLNYKKSEALDLYVSLREERWELVADGFKGEYSDSARTLSPAGYGFLGRVGLFSKVSWMARYEHLSASPLDGNVIRGFFTGPVFDWSESFKTFAYFKRQESQGGQEDTFQVRMRMRL